MEQRVSLVTLGVADVARSRRFYERMGWRAAEIGDESVAFFQCGGIVVALYAIEALVEDAGFAEQGTGFGGIALAHNVRERDEVDRILAQAEVAGGRILKPGRESFWGGYIGHFADPDGYPWEVAWNPGFEIGEDGSIRLPG